MTDNRSTSYTYYPMHMHLHAGCDYGASMAMHMYNARSLGMRYLWYTDHDTRTGVKKNPVNGFSFDSPELIKEEPAGGFYGFRTTDEKITYAVEVEKRQLRLSFTATEDAQWQESGIYFVSNGTRHTSSLSAEVTLSLDLKEVSLDKDSRLIFDVKLSQRPPECRNAHLLYVLGNTEELAEPHTQVIPVQISCGKLIMPISKDVLPTEEMGGKDNAFDTLTVILQAKSGAEVSVVLGDFEIQVEKSYEQVHQSLKIAAAESGKYYGITPFVSFEVSGAGEHKNCYTTSVPTIDYQKANYCVSACDAAQHIKEHNGIFAINHPFAISDLKRKVFTPVERMKILAKMSAELIANRAYGADLIEVGFPEGRNGFALEEYTRLWDTLSSAGLFLTGYGCSDSHRDNKDWFTGNNFAAYLGVCAELTHPIAEETFTQAMKMGRVYTADPVKLRGTVDFRTEWGHPMGSVFLSKSVQEVPIVFSMTNAQPGWQFRLIENGNLVETVPIMGETFSWESVLRLRKNTVHFQRAEVWNESGRCVLLTNPIYLIHEELFAGEIPMHRIGKETE